MRAMLLTAGLLAGAGVPGQAVVVPSIAGVRQPRPSLYVNDLFFGFPFFPAERESHCQMLYDTADVGVAAGLFRALRFRRPSGPASGSPNSFQATITIRLVVQPWSANVASPVFATNLGTGSVLVFQGRVSVSRNDGWWAWPAPWERPIPFLAPFLYARTPGGSLLVDWVQVGGSSFSWPVEGMGLESGDWDWDVSPCAHSGGAEGGPLVVTPAVLGRTWQIAYGQYPSNVPSLAGSVLLLGSQGSFGRFGGLTLPVLLANLGLPVSDPLNCKLGNDALLALPMTYVPGTGGNTGQLIGPPLAIPGDPLLAGHSFFVQPLASDTHPQTRQLQLHTSWGLRFGIGSGVPPPAAMVVAVGQGASTVQTGIVRLGETVTFQLDP